MLEEDPVLLELDMDEEPEELELEEVEPLKVSVDELEPESVVGDEYTSNELS